MSNYRADMIDCKPRFEFTADSDEPCNKAGIALWVYSTDRRGETVDVIVRQRFDSFDAAYAMDELIRVAFQAGCTRGEIRVRDAILSAVRPYTA
jgi:hypothetical protein